MYSSILVPVDLDEPSSWAKAVPTALAIGRCFDARLTMATVVSNAATAAEQWSPIGLRELLATTSARLRTLTDRLCGAQPVETLVGQGGVCAVVLALAEQAGADLIVLSSHRPALRDRLIGANAARIVRRAPCSVLVVRD